MTSVLSRQSLGLFILIPTLACSGDGSDGARGEQGPPGGDGATGAAGANALVLQSVIPPGEDCAFGGVRISSGVDTDGDATLDEDEITATNVVCSTEAPFTLQLLHFADIDGNEQTALANVDEFSALIDGFRRDPVYGPATLVLSSGDNLIPGPRWFAAADERVGALTGSRAPGNADHFLMNRFGVNASALGNHELDQGPGAFANTLGSNTVTDDDGVVIAEFSGTRFPYLAANVEFSGEEGFVVGENGSAAQVLGGQVAGSATFRIGSELIGLVGASTPELPSITSVGDLALAGSVDDLSALAAEIQPEIDALSDAGVDKIILVSHMQRFDIERSLAAELRNVDIIIAGGSNTRLGDETDALFPGDESFDGDYPVITTDADGETTLVVNTDGDYKYLGRLVVAFDAEGRVLPDSINPAVSGAWASEATNVLISGGEPDAQAVAVRDAVNAVISEQFTNTVGNTAVFLEGRRALVRSEETNLGNLTADSMKWYAEQCTELVSASVIALKNGGGIRAEIGDVIVDGNTVSTNPPANEGLENVNFGDISEGQIRATLRFNNGLVVVELTGQELKQVLEHSVAGAAPGATPGAFPQVAGLAFGFDPNAASGERVTDLYVDTDRDGIAETALYIEGEAQPLATNTYSVVTLKFLADGGDDYPYPQFGDLNRRQIFTDDDGVPEFPVLTDCDPGRQPESESKFTKTGHEQDALAEYLLAFFPPAPDADSTAPNPFAIEETPPAEDRRIQNLGVIDSFTAPEAP